MKKTLTLEIKSDNPIDLDGKIEKIKQIASLNDKDLECVYQVSKIESEDKDRLRQIAQQPKALQALKTNWFLLKIKLGL